MEISVWDGKGPSKKRLTVDLTGEFTITVAILRCTKIAITLRSLRYWNQQSDLVKEGTCGPVTSSSTSL
jgi:hypothetical protein